MERLWAPWRMTYVEVKQPPGCVFCVRPQSGRDREELILHRGHTCFVIMNLFPYNNGHLMIVPFRHTADLLELDDGEASEFWSLTRLSLRVLRECYGPEGCNLGMNLGRAAGAGIADHLHLHVVPRWNGDCNFMPVVAEVKVLPEALMQSYDRLRAGFERLAIVPLAGGAE
jgi:ATP adenylyltransferase